MYFPLLISKSALKRYMSIWNFLLSVVFCRLCGYPEASREKEFYLHGVFQTHTCWGWPCHIRINCLLCSSAVQSNSTPILCTSKTQQILNLLLSKLMFTDACRVVKLWDWEPPPLCVSCPWYCAGNICVLCYFRAVHLSIFWGWLG